MEETQSIASPIRGFAHACVAVLFAACAFFAFALQAQAATTMYVSPASGSFAPGASFTVGVYISTPSDKPANAISSTVSFPTNLLEVSSVSTAGSIVTLWVANPTYSNANGSVHFEGVIVNPGYNGNAGKLVSITFKAKASGTANVTFPSGSILANDGLGTNILTGFGSGKYTITGGETPAPTPTPTTPPVGVPAAPTISSSTHPVPGAWFSGNDPVFSWKMPSGVTGVNILADHNPTTDPGNTSDGVFSTYSYTDVDDGIWYVHLKFQNVNGWGPTSHYKFQIDTTAPAPFDIKLLDGKEVTIPEPRISFFTEDTGSGVDHYIVKVNGEEVGNVPAADVTRTSEYKLPPQTDGEKTVTVDAVDKAGNAMSSRATFTVTLPPAPEEGAETEGAWWLGDQFPGLNFIMLMLGLLLLLALLFALAVLWRSSGSWGLLLVGRRKNSLLKRLIRLRTFVARHFRELERDVVATNYTSVEKKTAARVAKNLRAFQEELNKEIEYLSE
jgi:hypothetical protein